jgi:peptidoglycan/LPS O-acetylase OafA/YrhL
MVNTPLQLLESTHPAYRSDIDGLRAVAVLSVVFYHAFPKAVPGGFVGVDVFFIISGFLISSIVFKSLQLDAFSFADFYGRRVRRIFPALALLLSACFAFGWFALVPVEYKQLGRHIAGGAGFVSNFLLWKESGYFDSSAELKPLLHLWSLGIEEQFYIVWPALLYFAWKRRFNLLSITLALIATSFFFNVNKVSHDATASFYSPASRIWELLLGSVAAYVSLFKKDLLSRLSSRADALLQRVIYDGASVQQGSTLRNIAAFAGAALITLAVFKLSKERAFPGWWAVVPTLGALLLIAAGPAAWINEQVLSHRIMVFFGKISFPLYLWHWPLISFARIVDSTTPPAGIRLAAVGASVLLAFATYRLIEVPVRFGGRARQKTWVLCMLMATIGLIGFGTFARDGYTSRMQEVSGKYEDLVGFQSYGKRFFQCNGPGAPYEGLDFCLQSREGAPSMAIWGDSHADSLFPGIATSDPTHNWLMIGHASCAPLTGVKAYLNGWMEDMCLKKNAVALKGILDNKEIGTVVVASLGPYYISDKGFAAAHTGTYDPSNYHLVAADAGSPLKTKSELFFHGLNASIALLENAGKKVVLVQDVPEMPFDAMACFDRPFSFSKPRCALARSVVDQRQAEYRHILERLKAEHPKIVLFDSTKALCDNGECRIGTNSALYYRDSHHLSVRGSQRVARELLQQMAEQNSAAPRD